MKWGGARGKKEGGQRRQGWGVSSGGGAFWCCFHSCCCFYCLMTRVFCQNVHGPCGMQGGRPPAAWGDGSSSGSNRSRDCGGHLKAVGEGAGRGWVDRGWLVWGGGVLMGCGLAVRGSKGMEGGGGVGGGEEGVDRGSVGRAAGCWLNHPCCCHPPCGSGRQQQQIVAGTEPEPPGE